MFEIMSTLVDCVRPVISEARQNELFPILKIPPLWEQGLKPNEMKRIGYKAECLYLYLRASG